MKVQIIGYGVIGKALGYLAEQLGHELFVYDPYVKPESKIESLVDVSFICTPEMVVEDAIKTLIEGNVYGLYVIRSTVPVGETERLSRKYKVHICHNPEFLREKYAFEDVMAPSRVLIGKCCDEHAQLLNEFYDSLNTQVYIADTKETELTKLVANALRATIITFWNEVDELCQKVGCDPMRIAGLLPSLPPSYGTKFFGEPFGGKCLPKDLEHLIEIFHSRGLNPLLFEAVKKFNEKLKRGEK